MLRKLAPIAAAVGAWWCVAHLGPTGQLAADPYRYVPLAGSELFEKLTPDRCVPHVEEMMRHANWTIGVQTGGWGCMGFHDAGTYELRSDGSVTYARRGMTRTLALTPDELETVRTMGRLDCAVPHTEDDGVMYVSVGAPARDGYAISTESELGRRLTEILRAAVLRRVTERAAELAGVSLHGRVGRLRVALDGRTLRLWRGRHQLAARELDPETFVNLIDAIVLDDPWRREDPDGVGIVRLNGASYGFDLDFWSDDGLAPLAELLSPFRT